MQHTNVRLDQFNWNLHVYIQSAHICADDWSDIIDSSPPPRYQDRHEEAIVELLRVLISKDEQHVPKGEPTCDCFSVALFLLFWFFWFWFLIFFVEF